jgi:hypothetical protein
MSEEEKPKPPQRPQAGQMGGPPRMSLKGHYEDC